MSMPWTATDTRYLVALLAAIALVLYLVAGNFGLVPSPITRVASNADTGRVIIPGVTDEGPAASPSSPGLPSRTPGAGGRTTSRRGATPAPRDPGARAPTAAPTSAPPTPRPSPVCVLPGVCL